jgi:hypothetical protein
LSLLLKSEKIPALLFVGKGHGKRGPSVFTLTQKPMQHPLYKDRVQKKERRKKKKKKGKGKENPFQ